MSDHLHQDDELIKELEGLAIRTTQGSYIKVEDARKLLEKRKEAKAVEKATAPAPKTLVEAREGAKRALVEMGFGNKGPHEPGRSVGARGNG